MSIKAYRSIGEAELRMLLFAKNPIYGKRIWGPNVGCHPCTDMDYGFVCFFEDSSYKWRDKEHKFDIEVELQYFNTGFGIYKASKPFAKTHVFTGREGSAVYTVPEVYSRCYDITHVRSIRLYNYYANWFIEKHIKPVCDEYGIELIIK